MLKPETSGRFSWPVALTFVVPSPVAVAPSMYLTAAGATAAAGTARFEFETLFVGTVHVELVPQPVVAPVMVEAVVGNV